ncbi:GGDEF domain-containing protein [Demequina sediminicola]|uniref:GGDEF domain-containing protein n=1 Tax=Demequina sediminicola TaxID=1095026 RepID=UPI0007818D82|nr:diguanylate cyclase [Demequina sediminicola]
MAAEGHVHRSGGAFAAVVSRFLERRIGGRSGEVGRAVASAHAFLLLCLSLTIAYDIFYLSFDAQGLSTLILVHNVWIALYLGGIVLARLGYQFAAAFVALIVPAMQMVYSSYYLGWEAGVHLFLLTAAPLLYLILTERQRIWRVVWMAISLTAFLVCQLTMPASRALYEMPRTVLNGMFSVAAAATALLLFTLAAVFHYRSELARKVAAQNAMRAEYLANTDALTGLATRRPVLEILETLSAPNGIPYCVAIADVDRFKNLNDEFGHSCGDTVLAELGVRARAEMRVSDSVGRWGGEEFIFVLPDAALEDAAATMDRVRRAIGEHDITCADHVHRATVSIGVTEGEHVGTAHHAIKRADDALYQSKQEGRDRVSVVWPETTENEPMPQAADRRDPRGAGA